LSENQFSAASLALVLMPAIHEYRSHAWINSSGRPNIIPASPLTFLNHHNPKGCEFRIQTVNKYRDFDLNGFNLFGPCLAQMKALK